MKIRAFHVLHLLICALVAGPAAGVYANAGKGPKGGMDSLRRWNRIAHDASGLDHGTAREQLGPGRASRALAIVQIAVFDAVNAVSGNYESFTDVQAPRGPVSLDAAIAQSAHDTLVALFPSQTANLNRLLSEDLAAIENKNAR